MKNIDIERMTGVSQEAKTAATLARLELTNPKMAEILKPHLAISPMPETSDDLESLLKMKYVRTGAKEHEDDLIGKDPESIS